MLAALASAQAARDPSTAAHCTRVTHFATRLASWMGWDNASVERLRVGARVHDIGKVMVSERILRKRGPLSPAELAEIRTHPTAGARLIAPVGPAQYAIPYVLFHHERWDGDGYPTRRPGADVPEGARLLAVVDAFDAMTSTRPYRRALPIMHALAEIARCAGTQFDPEIADAFLLAWSAGTKGRDVVAPVVILPQVADSNEFVRWLPQARGKFVLVDRPRLRRRGRELAKAPPRPRASTSRGGSPRR